MAVLLGLTSEVIAELTRLQTNDPLLLCGGGNLLPGMLPVGDDRSILTSPEMEAAIHRVAVVLGNNDPVQLERFGFRAFGDLVRDLFGPALLKIDLDDPIATNAEAVLADIWESLAAAASAAVFPMEHVFGCALFGNSDVKPFQIGPVKFEERNAWLARQVDKGVISRISQRRIQAAWKGLKLKRRKAPLESMSERDVLDVIGNCSFVCSVETTELARARAQEKALLAARLALASVALLWRTPSRALSGLNLLHDRTVHHQVSLTSRPGMRPLASRRKSHLPHGPVLRPGQWESLLAEAERHFEVAGEVLRYFVNPAGKHARPSMMSVLAHAILWFHEACRESSPVLAVVKFAASMDALSGGKGEHGICELLARRAGFAANAQVFPDGTTTRTAVERIYRNGRSRTMHGSNAKLGHDWSQDRGRAEQLARLSLVYSMDWIARNEGRDEPLLLLR